MDCINVGMIGCGRISDLHFKAMDQLPGLRLRAVCDLDPELARQKKAQWGADRAYTDYREMLRDSTVDAVEILSPQSVHTAMTVDAARAGKHIALQKPMTTDLKNADEILAGVRKAGVRFKVTDNYLFYPPIQLAKSLIDQGEIGTPSGLRIKLITAGSGGWEVPADAWKWRLAEKEAGRGFQTFDHGHHLWTTAWYLLGEVERVSAWIDSLDGIIDSPAVFHWKYKGQIAYGSCDFVHCPEMEMPSDYYANDEWLEITGSKGIIVIPRCTGQIRQGPGVRLFSQGKWQEFDTVETDWASGFVGAAANFRDTIQGEAKPMLSGEQARDILRLSLAMARSATDRREIYPEELDSPWGRFYSLWQQKKDLGLSLNPLKHIPWGGKKEAALAGQARELTCAMLERFDAQAAGEWEGCIGICLAAQGGAGESAFCLRVKDGKADLREGEVPEDAQLTLSVPAGTWAAILLGQKRIETALLQGRLKLSGKAELGLKLRSVFGI